MRKGAKKLYKYQTNSYEIGPLKVDLNFIYHPKVKYTFNYNKMVEKHPKISKKLGIILLSQFK